MTEITNLPVSSIAAGNNDRKDFDSVKLEELAASIATFKTVDTFSQKALTMRPPNQQKTALPLAKSAV